MNQLVVASDASVHDGCETFQVPLIDVEFLVLLEYEFGFGQSIV